MHVLVIEMIAAAMLAHNPHYDEHNILLVVCVCVCGAAAIQFVLSHERMEGRACEKLITPDLVQGHHISLTYLLDHSF